MADTKKRIFSGIQPSGELTLGSYMGAIKNWVDLQDEYDCLYCIVDMHAITVRQDPATLRKRSVNQLAQYIACGLDPQKNIMFIQSHVPQHAELGWILGCYTQFGELSRMTQFKAKSAQHADNITAGLFTYPVLMAADILLYQADLVPVGEDQRQHVELTRDIAQRFNSVYSDTFVLPQAFIPKVGARLMSLDDPTTKMSKSLPDGCVNLMDAPEVIMKKFKRAVTDCETAVKYDKENKAGISNLLTIYCAATGKTLQEAEAEFEGQGYGVFKPAVGEAVVELLRPIREESQRIMDDKAYLESVYQDGAERARRLADVCGLGAGNLPGRSIGGKKLFREMRRKGQALPKEECEKILARCTSGVLALSGDEGYPYAVPVSYVYRAGKIYFHSATEGHKADAIKKCSKVSFCAVGMDEVVPEAFTARYRSVICFGRARILDGEEKRAAIARLSARYAPGRDGSAEIRQAWDRFLMVEIEVESMTGKRSR